MIIKPLSTLLYLSIFHSIQIFYSNTLISTFDLTGNSRTIHSCTLSQIDVSCLMHSLSRFRYSYAHVRIYGLPPHTFITSYRCFTYYARFIEFHSFVHTCSRLMSFTNSYSTLRLDLRHPGQRGLEEYGLIRWK